MTDRCEECGRRIWSLDATLRWVPGHVWVRLVLSRRIEPGHRWMYGHIVRRDTFSVRGWGLVVMRMPSRQTAADGTVVRVTPLRRPGR